MPALPTITIDDTVLFNRLVAAFVDAAGYRKWLKTALRDEVIRRETDALRQQMWTSERNKRTELEQAFPDEPVP